MDIKDLLGDDADALLSYECTAVPAADLVLPGPDIIDRVYAATDRSPQVLRNLAQLIGNGRLGGTGYISILPVDQGIEHSAASSFAPNPMYFDPQNIVELALEGGCNAVASTFGVLGAVSRRYAHRIPFIVKLNHNELLTYPNQYDQVMFGSVDQALELGAAGVGATVYFGSDRSTRQLQEVAEAFARAHELGMFTELWCYPPPLVGRSHGPGEPPRRHHRRRHHQAEAADGERWLQRPARLRQDVALRVRPPHHRPPHRPCPVAGRELLHGPVRAHQQRGRVHR